MATDALGTIQAAARRKDLEMSIHAVQEAYAESISPDDIRQALIKGHILEDYPQHRRGACCLIYGDTDCGRPLHLVCTSNRQPVLIITVYEPTLPKWITPTQRNIA
jgi:hypothetical protein